MAKLFQGADRRKIKKLQLVLEAVRQRDLKADDPAYHGSAISTKTVVFDDGDTPTVNALLLLNNRLIDVLAMNKV